MPSLVLIRTAHDAPLLAATLPWVDSELEEAGAIVVLGRAGAGSTLPLPPKG